MRVSATRVAGRQRVERIGDGVRRVAHRFVASDQVGVRIDEDDIVVAQPAGAVQIEEDGAAAEERFDVCAELGRIKPAQLRQELTLTADPLQQGSHRHG